MTKEWRQWEDLPPQAEEEVIDRMATFFVKNNIGLLAELVLQSGGPLTSLFANLWMGLYGPYFDVLGIDRYMAVLRRKKNLQKVLDKIDELEEEKRKKNKKP